MYIRRVREHFAVLDKITQLLKFYEIISIFGALSLPSGTAAVAIQRRPPTI